MNKIKKVSAIIVTHNRFNLFKIALDSIRNQTYPNLEIIVVDDASTDETESYCGSQTDIKYLRINLGDSKGANHARNVGLSAAVGDYIAYCDDDDQWLPDKTTEEVKLLEKKKDVGFVYCGRIICRYENGQLINENIERIAKSNRGWLKKRIMYTIPCVTSTIMFRRDLLLSVGGFDTLLKYWQEYELSMRLCQITKIDFVDMPLVKYRLDYSDSARKSSRYEQWVPVPQQIYNKHKSLYSRLNIAQKMMYWYMYYNDAYRRCLFSDNEFYLWKNKFMKSMFDFLTIPFRILKRFNLLF